MSIMSQRRRSRAARSVVPALLLLAASACEDADAGPPEHPERLDGVWAVEFRLEHSATLTRGTTGLPPVRGTVVLLESARARGVDGLSGPPTHYGVYAAALRPLGVRDGAEVPALAARLTDGDSVEIALNLERSRAMVGRGALEGDSVVGRWRAGDGRTAGRSSGRFVMRRPRPRVSAPGSRASGRRPRGRSGGRWPP